MLAHDARSLHPWGEQSRQELFVPDDRVLGEPDRGFEAHRMPLAERAAQQRRV